MDIFDIFWTFYLNHLSPLWGYFLISISGNVTWTRSEEDRWDGKKIEVFIFRWFKFTLKPPYSIVIGKLRLAIWDTSFWTFLLKFGHKGP